MEETNSKESSKTVYDGFTSLKNLGSGDSQYIADFVAKPEKVFRKLKKEIEFLPRDALTFKIYGKTFSLPRDKAFYADIEEDGSHPLYRYGGDYMPPVHEWSKTLKKLRDHVKNETGQYCNHCVVNQYRDGSDHIGLHKDKIKDFEPGTSVMTISFGIARLFRLKHCTTNETVDIILQPGSVFILGGKTNSEWKHSIVKRSTNEVSDVRISVTLRSIATRYLPSEQKIIESKKSEIGKRKRDESNEDDD